MMMMILHPTVLIILEIYLYASAEVPVGPSILCLKTMAKLYCFNVSGIRYEYGMRLFQQSCMAQ